MAKRNASSNGHDRLEEAMALLIHNQAAFLGQMAQTERAPAKRFRRIERELTAIVGVLSEQSRLLEQLPEAVGDKIGFKAKE